MAGPHAVAVAALILSVHGNMGRAEVSHRRPAGHLGAALPGRFPLRGLPALSGQPQSGQGGRGHNSFYGSGEVDAFLVVS